MVDQSRENVLLTKHIIEDNHKMSANFNNGTLRSLNRTPQTNSNSATNETGGGSVIETVRKRMQQMKDELESSQDQLHAYQVEREREKHAREQV